MTDKPTDADIELGWKLFEARTPTRDAFVLLVAQAIAQARREEREAILKLTHSYGKLSAAIRQRGNSDD